MDLHSLISCITISTNSFTKSGQTLKYVGLPSPDRVYKKRAGQKIFLDAHSWKKHFLVTNILS